MAATAQPTAVSKTRLWSGRVLSALVVLFLAFDGITKVLKVQAVMDASVRIGFPVSAIVAIGITLLICTALYVLPSTSILGAILVTGYLGGATAIQVRAGSSFFETAFPIIFGLLAWVGLFLRDDTLRAFIPLHNR